MCGREGAGLRRGRVDKGGDDVVEATVCQDRIAPTCGCVTRLKQLGRCLPCIQGARLSGTPLPPARGRVEGGHEWTSAHQPWQHRRLPVDGAGTGRQGTRRCEQADAPRRPDDGQNALLIRWLASPLCLHLHHCHARSGGQHLTPAALCLPQQFDKRRGLATGII